MILSFVYIIIYCFALGLIITFPKSDKKVSLGVEFLIDFVLLMFYEYICALVITKLPFKVNLVSLTVCNALLVVALLVLNYAGVGIHAKHEKGKLIFQQVTIDKVKAICMVLIALAVVIVFFIVHPGGTYGYTSADASTHFRYALLISRWGEVSGMNFTGFFNSVFIMLLSPLLRCVNYYIAVMIADTVTFLLLCEWIYVLMTAKAKNTKDKLFMLIPCGLCVVGYPLISYMILNSMYVTTSIMLTCMILYVVNCITAEQKENGDSLVETVYENRYLWVLLIVGLLSLALTYILIAPYVIACSILVILWYLFKSNAISKKQLAIVLGGGVVLFVVALFGISMVYARIDASGVAGIKGVFDFFGRMMSSEGYIYSRLFSDFLIFLPAIIALIVIGVQKKRLSVNVQFILIFMVCTFLTFLLCLFTEFSGYYYYKLYFVLWIVCWIVVTDFYYEADFQKVFRTTYFTTVLCIIALSVCKIEDFTYTCFPKMNHTEQFCEEIKIYPYVLANFATKRDSWSVNNDIAQVINYCIEENGLINNGAIVILTKEEPSNIRVAADWIFTMVGNGIWFSDDLKNDIEDSNQGKLMTGIVLKDSVFYRENKDILSEYLVEYENNHGMVINFGEKK